MNDKFVEVTTIKNISVYEEDGRLKPKSMALEKCFCKTLLDRKVVWNIESLEIALRLQHDGYAEYKTGFHAGWWELTEKGKKFACLCA